MALITSILAAPAAIGPHQLKDALILLSILTIIVCLVVMIVQRLKVRGLPGPPHHVLFGHLPVMLKTADHVPRDLHPQAQMTVLQRLYKLGDMFCVDIWPLMDQVYVVANPELAHQIAQRKPLPRHPMVQRFIRPFTGENSIMLTNGDQWKELKALFSAGFSNAHLMTTIPLMVDKTEVFCDLLAERAKDSSLFQMETLAARLTVDIIGLIVLGVDFDSLTGEDELVTAFRKLLTLMPDGQSMSLNPFRPLLRRFYGGVMDNYIRRAVRAHIANGSESKRRTLIDIAIDKYEEMHKGDRRRSAFSCGFEQIAIDNLKTFIFAGHDTSSTTISYVYHLLSRHPDALARVRQEHDTVLGKDLSQTASLLRNQPPLINQLPYTTAVIKETLRLYPAAGSLRIADKGTTFTPQKSPAITLQEPSLVWISVHTMHHDADLFPCPDEFHPERFLDGGWDGHTPPKDAYRPFEKGPRQCTGSEMAMIEIRIVLALTLRRFRFESAFDDWGRIHPDKTGGKVAKAFGDEAYQVFSATAKPKWGMPMRVFL